MSTSPFPVGEIVDINMTLAPTAPNWEKGRYVGEFYDDKNYHVVLVGPRSSMLIVKADRIRKHEEPPKGAWIVFYDDGSGPVFRTVCETEHDAETYRASRMEDPVFLEIEFVEFGK